MQLEWIETERLRMRPFMEREGEALLGFCGFRMFGDPDDGGREKPELMYGLDPHHWGRGYASEAAVGMLRFGFEECGIDPIHAGIDPSNTRSRRVLERRGMTGWRRIEHGDLPADYAKLARAEFRFQPVDAACRLIRRQE